MTQKALIDGLNRDLTGEITAIIQYLTYAARIEGLARTSLRAFFRQEIADELRHAQFLADKVAALGGEPATQPRAVPPATTATEMLHAIHEAERQAIVDYTQRIDQAAAAGDRGLVVALEDMVRDETTHAEEVMQLLRAAE